MTEADIQAFTSKLTQWCAAQQSVEEALIVGSVARNSYHEDSDIDVVLICRQPSVFTEDHSWVSFWAEPLKTQAEQYGIVTSIRSFYEGLEVEYAVAPLSWLSKPLDEGTLQVLQGGYLILLDKSGRADDVKSLV